MVKAKSSDISVSVLCQNFLLNFWRKANNEVACLEKLTLGRLKVRYSDVSTIRLPDTSGNRMPTEQYFFYLVFVLRQRLHRGKDWRICSTKFYRCRTGSKPGNGWNWGSFKDQVTFCEFFLTKKNTFCMSSWIPYQLPPTPSNNFSPHKF